MSRLYEAPNGFRYVIEEVPTWAAYIEESGAYLGTFDEVSAAEKACEADAEATEANASVGGVSLWEPQ